jgi:hypothetical protein
MSIAITELPNVEAQQPAHSGAALELVEPSIAWLVR